MRTMKKLSYLLLFIPLCFGLSSCSSDDDSINSGSKDGLSPSQLSYLFGANSIQDVCFNVVDNNGKDIADNVESVKIKFVHNGALSSLFWNGYKPYSEWIKDTKDTLCNKAFNQVVYVKNCDKNGDGKIVWSFCNASQLTATKASFNNQAVKADTIFIAENEGILSIKSMNMLQLSVSKKGSMKYFANMVNTYYDINNPSTQTEITFRMTDGTLKKFMVKCDFELIDAKLGVSLIKKVYVNGELKFNLSDGFNWYDWRNNNKTYWSKLNAATTEEEYKNILKEFNSTINEILPFVKVTI
jgi:hypothetical protein